MGMVLFRRAAVEVYSIFASIFASIVVSSLSPTEARDEPPPVRRRRCAGACADLYRATNLHASYVISPSYKRNASSVELLATPTMPLPLPLPKL